MQTFIGDILDDLLLKSHSISEYTFILPSKRAGVFLKKEIKAKVKKAVLVPEVLSIEDFIENLSSLNLIDPTKLLFEFYTVYSDHTDKGKIETFDNFSKWASIALQDFNELDRHRIDSNYIFSYLQNIDRIENWEIDKETHFTKNYFSFFNKLHLYYNTLYERLLNKKLGYQGMLYREAVENIPLYIENNSSKKLIFVGFNALNTSEEIIIKQLLENELASIYWDADEFYFNNNQTSIFLNKYLKNWKYYEKQPFNWVKNHFKESKNIQIIGAPKNNSQLKYVGEILSKETKNNFQNTALVLADESLLPLALNSFSEDVKNVNITMGYGLKNMGISKLFHHILKLHINTKNGRYYYKEVLKILNHPSIKSICKSDFLINEIIKNNFSYLSYETLSRISRGNEEIKSILSVFSSPNSDNVSVLLHTCSDLIEILKTATNNQIEKEFLFKIKTIFIQLETLNKEYGYIKDPRTLFQFYIQLLQNEKLSFKGEPLSGLQLMGVLETRVLDFETVIVTSVNEGVLPSSKSENSFIPYDVKREIGLPTYQEKDAIFSYHFYRLLQRAKNIYLLYNTENDQYGSGEKSRFITQLEMSKSDEIKNYVVSPKVNSSKIPPKIIKKNTSILKALEAIAIEGFSPTTLTSYMYNPIDFYKQKVLRVKEVDELEETLAVNTLGTIIHKTLEALYIPVKGQILHKEDIDTMNSRISIEVKKKFEEEYKNGDISTGKNLMIFNIAKQYVSNFLDKELDLINKGNEIKIIALEHKIETEIFIEELDSTIRLKGEIDRIDQLNGTTRIIDYKTGKVDQNKVSLVHWDDLITDYEKYSKSFQVLAYAYLMHHNNQVALPIEAGIISFKNLNAGFLKFTKKDREGSGAKKETLITEDTLLQFEIQLKKLVLEIFNIKIPFEEKLITKV